MIIWVFKSRQLQCLSPPWTAQVQCKVCSPTPCIYGVCVSTMCSREVLQEVLDTDLSNEAFPFSTHKVVNAAGHQVRPHACSPLTLGASAHFYSNWMWFICQLENHPVSDTWIKKKMQVIKKNLCKSQAEEWNQFIILKVQSTEIVDWRLSICFVFLYILTSSSPEVEQLKVYVAVVYKHWGNHTIILLVAQSIAVG